jgi:hypothetical protein
MTLRILGVAHIVVAVILLPATAFLGFTSALIVIPGLIWLIVLGLRLWRPYPRLRTALRNTHLVLAPFAILLTVYGFYALRKAGESAEGGGGLLGAFGLIPIVMGIFAAALSIASLCVSYSSAFTDLPVEKNPGGVYDSEPPNSSGTS